MGIDFLEPEDSILLQLQTLKFTFPQGVGILQYPSWRDRTRKL
jgi:hypothetical protein